MNNSESQRMPMSLQEALEISQERKPIALSLTSIEINNILENIKPRQKKYSISNDDGSKIEIIYESKKSEDNKSHFSLEVSLYKSYIPGENKFYQFQNYLYEYGENGLSKVNSDILFDNSEPNKIVTDQKEIEKVSTYLNHIKTTLLLPKDL